MSRVGKKPIPIPDKVTVKTENGAVWVKGPLGELSLVLSPDVKCQQKDKELQLSLLRPGASAIFGTTRARVANLVTGVSEGFKKILQISGVGYKAQVQGQKIMFTLGFSHPVEFQVPKGIKAETDKKLTTLTIGGADKDLVGETAALIRALKKPEPYKGTGIKYAGERIHRKAGKTAAGAGAGAGAGAKK